MNAWPLLVLSLLVLSSCTRGGNQDRQTDLQSTIEANVTTGASIAEVRTFLDAKADGSSDRLERSGSSTFLLERGVNPGYSYLVGRWEGESTGVVRTTTQAYFVFDGDRLLAYYLRDVYTGP
jgi:hypothetical protein